MSRIAVLVSGGVDSSVALRLLQEEGGHDLVAFYLKIWLEDDMAFLGSCPWEEDLRYVRQVCDSAGVPLEIVSLQNEYFQRVVEGTIDELRAGRTPSPDVVCNERIKFGAFLEYFGDRFDEVATGHHARVVRRDGRSLLLRGRDPVKDQTYFLCHLDQRQVSRCVFPIGRYVKHEIRDLARSWRLPNADRPDSQGICFLGRIPYAEFVHFHLGERPGDIVEKSTGRILGRHRGFWFHTIGQRKGLGLADGPWYVVGKDIDADRIFVEHRDRMEEMKQSSFRVSPPNWIGRPPDKKDLAVRIRHGETLIGCRVAVGQNRVDVSLDEADAGIAPGQIAAFYDGEICLGGGPIE